MSSTPAIRDGFGEGILAAGKANTAVCALSADLDESLRLNDFKTQLPDQFIQVGVAEQNLLGVAAGLALAGYRPFATSFAAFNPGRNWDQLRASICYSNLPVVIVGGHAGLTVGEDGATHQALEDIAITQVLPNLHVIVPCDAEQAKQATIALAQTSHPTYLRLSRASTPIVTHQLPFIIGKAQVLRPGTDASIFACGTLVSEALKAAQLLHLHNVDCQVINLHTIKPIDEDIIIQAANQSGIIVTAEEHQVTGGMGAAVSSVITRYLGTKISQPTIIEHVGMPDAFGESGPAAAVMSKWSLTAEAIVQKTISAIKRKKGLHL